MVRKITHKGEVEIAGDDDLHDLSTKLTEDEKDYDMEYKPSADEETGAHQPGVSVSVYALMAEAGDPRPSAG